MVSKPVYLLHRHFCQYCFTSIFYSVSDIDFTVLCV